MTHTSDPVAPAAEENHLIAERRQKLARLREEGVAFPNDFVPEDKAADLQAAYHDHDKPALEALAQPAKVGGRIMLKRVMGKASFATLQDGSGRIQIYLDKNGVGEAAYESFKTWDIGDIIGVEGTLFKTNKGELSVR
ncbi:MAG: lysine--tRNA ligase, partial [Pusillimonas sp.]|nr:lysine--tRNA ligase [Pusillimonas sp.]